MKSITVCRSCGSRLLKDILSLGDQQLSDFVSLESSLPKEVYPLNLVKCDTCHLVQLRETTPTQKLYTDHYGYRSGINHTMRQELATIVQKSVEKLGRNPVVAVDIGANDGTLLSGYPSDVIRVGFEPVQKLAEICKSSSTHVFPTFFNAEDYQAVLGNQKAEVITAISMFYDLDDPNSFVRDLALLLAENGILVIQQNYLASMLEKNAYCNIVHEHLEYYSLFSLEHLLQRHGLKVIDAEESPINGGSFRVYVQHMSRLEKMRLAEEHLKLQEDQPYKEFADRVKNAKEELVAFLNQEKKRGKEIYLYGASTRGNTILQYSQIYPDLAPFAVERNPEKWGKKILSTATPIISEQEARDKKPDYFLVLPWFFKEEIIARERDYLKQGGALIFPLPKLEVVRA